MIKIGNACSDTSTTQSNTNVDLGILDSQMMVLVRRYEKSSPARGSQIISPAYRWYGAKELADRSRLEAGMKNSMTIDLDSADDNELSHIRTMVYEEKKALNAFYKMVAILRADLIALEEIREVCCRVLELTDETSKGIDIRLKALSITAEIKRRYKLLLDRLGYLGER